MASSPIDYPIQPKEHGVDFLLDNRHLWLRSPRQVAILRVRHEIEQAIHDFFYERGFVRVDTPILTAAIGERSGLFQTEYFDEGIAYLAQTGQLYGEAAAAALGLHLHLRSDVPRREVEDPATPDRVLDDRAGDGVLRLERQHAAPGSHARVTSSGGCSSAAARSSPCSSGTCRSSSASRRPFPRIDYTDAVATLQKKGSAIKWGDDLGAEDESLLVEDHETPVFVCNYPEGGEGLLHEGESRRSAHGALR